MSNKRVLSNYAWMGLIGVAVGLMAAGCIPVTPPAGGQISVTASANPATVAPNAQSVVTATVTDATGTVTYAWTIAGQGAFVGATSGASVTVLTSAAGTAIATVTATDSGTGTSATATATITVEAVTPPASDLAVTATATPASLALPDTSTLFASPTGGTPGYTYSWLQTSGAAALVATPTGQSTLVTLPEVGSYTFVVTVTDAAGDSVTSAAVTVTAASTSLAFTASPLDDLIGSTGADTFSAVDATIQTTDKADGGTGDDSLDIVLIAGAALGNPAPKLTSIETINITDVNTDGASAFNAINATGVQAINVVGSEQDLTVNNLAALVTAGITDSANALVLGFAADAIAGAADEATILLSNALAGAAVTYPGVEVVNVVSNDAENTLALTAAAAETLNITGAADLILGAIPATVETVDGSAATGALTLTTAANDVAVTTGSGDDVVTWTAGQFNEDDSVDLGDGTDTLVLNNADASVIDADEAAVISNTERLQVSDTITALDATLISGLTTVVAAGNINGTIAAASGQTLELPAAVTNASAVTVAGDAVNDTFGLVLGTDAAGVNNTAALTFTGVEILNVVSQGGANTLASLQITPSDPAGPTVGTSTVNITGDEDVTITTTNAQTIAAADLTGVLTVTATVSTDITSGSAGDTINGSAASDVISTGAGDDTIDAKAGDDAIDAGEGDDIVTGGPGADLVTLGAGEDTFNYATGADNTDTFTDFAAGEDGDIYDTDFAPTTGFGADTNADVTPIAGAVTLATATDAVFEVVGTLRAAITDFTSGAQVLAAISDTSVSVSANSDQALLIIYSGGNAYLYEVIEGGDAVVAAADITLVGIFQNVASGAFVEANIQ